MTTTVGRWAVIVLLVVHGLIHLMGAAKGLGWAEVNALKEPIGVGAGVVWLVTAVLVIVTAVMIAVGRPHWWWVVAGGAVVLSQAVIFTSWADAKAGTVANVALLAVAVLGFGAHGPASFSAEWDHRTEAALAATATAEGVVTEADLTRVPEPVARYIQRCGAVGQPRIRNFFAEVHGRIRSGPDKPWMAFTGRQLNTYGQTPQRLFYLQAEMFRLPVTVFHVFDTQAATMRGKVVSLVPILDAKGPEMNRSETVTLFNDMVVFAPAALLDADVRWTELSPTRVRAAYSRAGETITAELVFDEDGDIVDFFSQDRSRASTDGTSFTTLPWNTPITGYVTRRGHRVAVEGTAMWDAADPEGHFSYIEFTIDDLTYNVTEPAIPHRSDASLTKRAFRLAGAS